jgi:uncharacterized protein DUF6223
MRRTFAIVLATVAAVVVFGGLVYGNGVVGGAAALVLGLIAVAIGGLALVRSRRVALELGRTT